MHNGYASDSSEDEPLINIQKTETVQNLNFHNLLKYNKVFCEFCDETFTNRYDAVVHTKDHIIIPLLRQNYIQCPECLYHFSTEDEYERHKIIKHTISIRKLLRFESDDELVSSDEESKNVIIPSNLNNLHNFGCYRCKYCLMIFNTRYHLLLHNLGHLHITKPKVHLCLICEGYFETKFALKYHLIKKHHNASMPNVILNTCSKCNLEYNNFNLHSMRYHWIYCCDQCKLPFDSRLGLKLHLRKHKKVKCQDCQTEMSSEELSVHVESYHNDLKVCDTCLIFTKNRSRNTLYSKIGACDNVDGRQACNECHKRFVSLNIVRCVGTKDYKWNKERKAKILTNVERLKNIKIRLKKIRCLSKY